MNLTHFRGGYDRPLLHLWMIFVGVEPDSHPSATGPASEGPKAITEDVVVNDSGWSTAVDARVS